MDRFDSSAGPTTHASYLFELIQLFGSHHFPPFTRSYQRFRTVAFNHQLSFYEAALFQAFYGSMDSAMRPAFQLCQLINAQTWAFIYKLVWLPISV